MPSVYSFSFCLSFISYLLLLLTSKGYTLASAEVTKLPANYSTLDSEDDITMMTRLLDALDDNDDVTNVWHNWES